MYLSGGENLSSVAIGIIVSGCIFFLVLVVALVMCLLWNRTTCLKEIYQRLRSRRGAPLRTDNLETINTTAA